MIAAYLAFSYPYLAIFAESIPFLREVFVAILAIFSGLLLYQMGSGPRTALLLGSLGTSLLLIVLVYTTVTIGDATKVVGFLAAYVVFGVLLSVVLQNEIATTAAPRIFATYTIVLLCVFAAFPSEYREQRISINDANPIWMARALGFGAISCVFMWVTGTRKPTWMLIVATAAIAGIWLTGSRGPLLATFAAIGFGVFAFHRKALPKYATTVLVGLVVIYAIDVFTGLISSWRGLDSDAQGSAWIRYEMGAYSINHFLTRPSGIGVGNFIFGPFRYPHNIFLELPLEWGWICGGFLLLVIAGGSACVFIYGAMFYKWVLVAELINSGVSGDVTSPRLLYALVLYGLYLGLRRLLDPPDERFYKLSGQDDAIGSSGMKRQSGSV